MIYSIHILQSSLESQHVSSEISGAKYQILLISVQKLEKYSKIMQILTNYQQKVVFFQRKDKNFWRTVAATFQFGGQVAKCSPSMQNIMQAIFCMLTKSVKQGQKSCKIAQFSVICAQNCPKTCTVLIFPSFLHKMCFDIYNLLSPFCSKILDNINMDLESRQVVNWSSKQ